LVVPNAATVAVLFVRFSVFAHREAAAHELAVMHGCGGSCRLSWAQQADHRTALGAARRRINKNVGVLERIPAGSEVVF
jgi:hypothetical protein